MSVIAPPVPATAGTATHAADLLLVRLLPPAKQPPSPKRVRDELSRFFRRPPTAEQWQEITDLLRADGLLTVKPLQLTEAGRDRALAFLGLKELPPRTTWKALKARHLLWKALGLPPT